MALNGNTHGSQKRKYSNWAESARRTRRSTYPTGIKISDTELDALTTDGTLNRHEFHGEWNYTLKPTKTE